jgi:amino-acid N-acetyltransferase
MFTPAVPADVPAILDLIEPLEAKGVLVKRPPEVLARDVHSGFYYVYTRDDTLLACAQLKRYSATHAEIGCLVVTSQYRRQGCGDAMLGFLERTAIAAGVSHIFALSTHTMQWFQERGFSQCALEALPERRQLIYNHKRASKIYMKSLASSRLLDAQELFWVENMSG